MRRTVLLLAALLLPARAGANFHLWELTKAFSNADGSVQFIELFTAAAGQEFLDGHFIRTEASNVALQTFNFASDLPVVFPDTTANHHFLLATPDFAAVAGFAPDYEIPAGFIEIGVADEI